MLVRVPYRVPFIHLFVACHLLSLSVPFFPFPLAPLLFCSRSFYVFRCALVVLLPPMTVDIDTLRPFPASALRYIGFSFSGSICFFVVWRKL